MCHLEWRSRIGGSIRRAFVVFVNAQTIILPWRIFPGALMECRAKSWGQQLDAGTCITPAGAPQSFPFLVRPGSSPEAEFLAHSLRSHQARGFAAHQPGAAAQSPGKTTKAMPTCHSSNQSDAI